MSIGQFRSTRVFAPRARVAATAVDRATFVVFALAEGRFAAAVEAVERVVRDPVACAEGAASSLATIRYGGATYALADLAAALGVQASPSPASRVLILAGDRERRAAVVDRVFEVVTIDAGIVQAVDRSRADLAWLPPIGVRGLFTRHDAPVIVLDVARLLDEALVAAHGAVAESRMERSS